MSRHSILTALFTSAFTFNVASYAQVSPHARPLVAQSVNESALVTRPGNVRPEVSLAKDLGKVSDSRQLQHVYLQLKRSPELQAELEQFLNDLHDPKSPGFHKWITSAQYGQRFGIAQEDLSAVTTWLESHGLAVNYIYPNLVIDFSGTAGQVSAAFHTEIHNLDVNGAPHIANMSDPQIPAALDAVVTGPVSLHDFKPSPTNHPRAQYTVNSTYQLVVPLDLQTIYNMNPAYAAGISGQGQTVVLLERTDLYSDGDWYTFRKTLGLSRKFPHGSFITVHPQPNASNVNNGGPCSDPGVVIGDDGEAAVDVEWASASAPNATVELASCADTDTNFGAFIALQNLVTEVTPPPAIMSLSYGSPESENGADGNAYISGLYALAEGQGVSLFVSTGDAGADVTDQNRIAATHGINVNALASTPYNVAAGGTDFGDTFLGENSIYWSATNGPSYNSALSYIPEIPWNDSCASQLIAFALGYTKTYGTSGSCNSAPGDEFLGTAAGSGGPSGCAFGNASIPGVVSGTCTGYPKPAYQTLVFGNPNDHARDLPDVSLFAANGVWGHYFVICYSDPYGGGGPCNNPPDTWAGAGGTSFVAPIMAGVQALINQAVGSPQGNPNFVFYVLAGTEYGASGSKACNSTLGNGTSPDCIFYDVTLGDMDVNCKPLSGVGTFDCFYPKTNPGANGVLSTSNTSYEPAYAATTGWDFATGIGSVNVYNLIKNWPGSTLANAAK
ncbi:MAG: protease pro-enzyme activation domain-containing protein [Bryobacteraceae bacterium]